jgi:hypothetical protein
MPTACWCVADDITLSRQISLSVADIDLIINEMCVGQYCLHILIFFIFFALTVCLCDLIVRINTTTIIIALS